MQSTEPARRLALRFGFHFIGASTRSVRTAPNAPAPQTDAAIAASDNARALALRAWATPNAAGNARRPYHAGARRAATNAQLRGSLPIGTTSSARPDLGRVR